MAKDVPNTNRAAAGDASAAASATHHRHWNPLLIAGIAAFAAVSFYLALIVASRVDDTLSPGNGLAISGIPLVDANQQPDVVTPEDRINILVMGLDLRRDEDPDTPGRTDTVFIFTIDPYSKTAGVLSIPRDLAVDIPVSLDENSGYFSDRVNTAYVHGEQKKKGDGPKYTVEAVQHTFDIPIDYYAVLNFNNFIAIVDELGGIDVDVPDYVWDNAYTDCQYCGDYHYVEFDQGPQHMDGVTALTYARLRHSDNDFKRIERQQLVMRAIGRKASSLGVLAGSNPKSLFDAYKDSVKTDISDLKIPGLALLGSQVGVDNIVMESLGEAVYPCPAAQCNGAAILLPIWSKIDEVKARVFGDGRLQQEAALIKILNGTPTPKLGENFAAYLRSQGVASDRITVDEQANGDLFDQTFVIDHGNHDYTAEQISKFLGFDNGARVRKYDSLPVEMQARFRDDLVGITVVLGTDATVPDLPRTVSDSAPNADSHYYAGGAGTNSTGSNPTTAVPDPEPTAEPTAEPPPDPTPEPTAEPPPEETPPAGG